MTKRNLFAEIQQGLEEFKRHRPGKTRLKTYRVALPDPKEIRDRMRLSQTAFAALMGVSIRTLQDWEQGRRKPRGPALSLLRVAARHPEALVA